MSEEIPSKGERLNANVDTKYSPDERTPLDTDHGLQKAMSPKARSRMFGKGRGLVYELSTRELRRRKERKARREAKRNAKKK